MTPSVSHPLAASTPPSGASASRAAHPFAQSSFERPGLFREIDRVLATPGGHVVLTGESGTGRSFTLAALERLHAGDTVVRIAARDADSAGGPWARALAALGAPADGHADAVVRALSALGGNVLLLVDDADALPPGGAEFAEAVLLALRSDAAHVHVVLAATPERTLADGLATPVALPRVTTLEAAEFLQATLAANGFEIEPGALATLAGLANGLPGEALRLAAVAMGVAQDRHRPVIADSDRPAIAEAARLAADAAHVEAWRQATIRARRGIFPEILLGCALAPHQPDGSFHVNDVRACLEGALHRELRGLTNQISVLAEDSRGRAFAKAAPAPNARYRFLDARLEAYALLAGFEGREIMTLPPWLAAIEPGAAEDDDLRAAA